MAIQRILINASYAPSLINFRGALIRDLIDDGNDVHVSAPDFTDQGRAAIEGLGATPHSVPIDRQGVNPLADLRYLLAMRNLIRRAKPDLVLNYTIKPNIWGSLAAASVGVRSVSMVTGLGQAFEATSDLRGMLRAKLVHALYRKAAEVNDAIIFQNPDDIADFANAGCLRDPRKAHRVYGSGVDLESFPLTPLPTAPVFLMAARLLVEKGVREYANAAMAIMAQYPEARFLLAGDFDDTPATVSAHEVESWKKAGIECLGWVQDIREALSRASVYVLPTFYREGCPRSALEAAAMGRAVVTTDWPGARETVRNGETGILVAPKNVGELSKAMAQLASDADLRERMGRNGRSFCEEVYDARKVNAMLRGLIGI